MGKRETGSSRRVRLASLALAMFLAACAAANPFEYHPIHEIPEGPGLVTGEDGEWVIYDKTLHHNPSPELSPDSIRPHVFTRPGPRLCENADGAMIFPTLAGGSDEALC